MLKIETDELYQIRYSKLHNSAIRERSFNIKCTWKLPTVLFSGREGMKTFVFLSKPIPQPNKVTVSANDILFLPLKFRKIYLEICHLQSK